MCVPARTGAAVRLSLSGELDLAVVPQLDRALRRAEADAARIILDLGEVELMDCAAAELLLAADRRIRRAGGRLTVTPAPAEVEWFLTLIGIDRQLELVPRRRVVQLTPD